MKILLVNKYWYARGGAERVVFLTKRVLEDAGHTVEVFGMKQEKNTLENEYFIDTIDYATDSWMARVMYGIKSVYNVDAKKRFAKLVDDFAPDVIHFHNIYHQLSYSLLDVVRAKNIPSVMTLHDYKMLSPNYTLFHHNTIDTSMLGGKYYRCLLHNAMGSWIRSFFAMCEAYLRSWKKWSIVVDWYIAPSACMKTLCKKSGIPMDNIQVVQNPIEEDTVSLPGNTVVYVGRLAKEKGVLTLLGAAQHTPHISYKIVGDGPEKSLLEQYCITHHIKNVEFCGWLEGETLDQAITAAKFVVVPSEWYENCPYSVLEVMAKGKVVIASAIGGIPELLPKACLFEPGDVDGLAQIIQQWYTAPLSLLVHNGAVLQNKVRSEMSVAVYSKKLQEIYTTITTRIV